MRSFFRSLTFGVLCVSALSAGSLDFTTLPLGTQASPIVLPEATLTSATGTFYAGAAGIDHEICALNRGSNCEADIDIVFNSTISGLTLVTSGYNLGDVVDFFAYDGSNNLIGSVIGHTGDGLVSGLSGISGIRRLYIDDRSSGAGFGYDQFEWTNVPEPSTLGLLALGLAAAGLLRRRS